MAESPDPNGHIFNLADLNQYPAKVVNEQTKDPAHGVTGAAPNFGRPMVPHIYTVQGRVGTISRVYRPSDEAMRHSLHNARFMRNECGIMECLEGRQRGTILLKWHLEPEDEKSASQQDLVAKLTDIIDRIPRFQEYRRNLLEALWYGKYGVAHNWGWERIKGHRRKTIKTWEPRHGDKIVFRYDDGRNNYDPRQVGIRVGADYQWDVIHKNFLGHPSTKIEPTDQGLAYFLDNWEREYLLAIHKHIIEDGAYEDPLQAANIHGVGIRSRIYWSWYQMSECTAWLMEYLERSALGVELWPYKAGNPQSEAKTREAAEKRIGGGRSIVLMPIQEGEDPALWQVQHLEPGMAGADAVKSVIQEFFMHRIKRYVLGQTLTSEADATGLGSGVADAHLATYMDIVRYDAGALAETITTDLVLPLKQQNFPKANDIHVKFIIDTEAADAKEMLEAYERAWAMGLKLKAADVASMIGATSPDEDDETLRNPQFEQMEQQQAMMEQQQAQGGGQPGAQVQGHDPGQGVATPAIDEGMYEWAKNPNGGYTRRRKRMSELLADQKRSTRAVFPDHMSTGESEESEGEGETGDREQYALPGAPQSPMAAGMSPVSGTASGAVQGPQGAGMGGAPLDPEFEQKHPRANGGQFGVKPFSDDDEEEDGSGSPKDGDGDEGGEAPAGEGGQSGEEDQGQPSGDEQADPGDPQQAEEQEYPLSIATSGATWAHPLLQGSEIQHLADGSAMITVGDKTVRARFGSREELQAAAAANPEAVQASAEGAGLGSAEGMVPAGMYRGGEIVLSPDATPDDMSHELIHAFADLGLVSEKDIQLFGTEEQLASAYQDWVKQGMNESGHGIFQRIRDFFASMLGDKGAQQRQAFRRYDRGRFLKDHAAAYETDGNVRFALNPSTIAYADAAGFLPEHAAKTLDLHLQVAAVDARMSKLIRQEGGRGERTVTVQTIEQEFKRDPQLLKDVQDLEAAAHEMGETSVLLLDPKDKTKLAPYALENRPKIWTNVRSAYIDSQGNILDPKVDKTGSWAVVEQAIETNKKTGKKQAVHLIRTGIADRKTALATVKKIKKNGARIKGKEQREFGKTGRSLSQTFLETLRPETFESIRGAAVRSVEEAYRLGQIHKIKSEFPRIELKPKEGETKGRKYNPADLLEKNLKNVTQSGDYRVATSIRPAHKTVASLNLNSWCPMFQIGNHGCYLDGCYVTSMAGGANELKAYQKAMYTGELLQLKQQEIDDLNALGGLRMNGMGDLSHMQKDQVRDVIKHAAMRGLQLKIITKQDATFEMVSSALTGLEDELKAGGHKQPDVMVQPSVDPYWVPITEDDMPGSAMEGYAKAIEKARADNDEDRASLLADVAMERYQSLGRATKIIDGVPYRKYGFDKEQLDAVMKKHPNLANKVKPRVVIGNGAEAAWAATHHPGAVVTWMHARVRAGMVSDATGGHLTVPSEKKTAEWQDSDLGNFDGRPEFIPPAESQSGKWEMVMHGDKGKAKPTKATQAVVDHIYQNYSPAKADEIFQNLKGFSCCQSGSSKDACQDCQVHCANGRSDQPQMVQLSSTASLPGRETPPQERTSAATSINSTKTPALFSKIAWQPGTTNVDVGGGKFETATDYLAERDVTNHVYDPYNRDDDHNSKVESAMTGKADTATLSNVLNVIEHPEHRQGAIRKAFEFLKPGGQLHVTVYHDPKKKRGSPKGKPDQWQEHRPVRSYLDEIRKVFPDATVRGNVITATKASESDKYSGRHAKAVTERDGTKGEISEVDGQFYVAGRFMPVHGESTRGPGKSGKGGLEHLHSVVVPGKDNVTTTAAKRPEGFQAVDSLLSSSPLRVGRQSRIELTGNTYAHKDAIKDMGGQWDSDSRTWSVPLDKSKKAAEMDGVSAKPKSPRIADETLRYLRLTREQYLDLSKKWWDGVGFVPDDYVKNWGQYQSGEKEFTDPHSGLPFGKARTRKD